MGNTRERTPRRPGTTAKTLQRFAADLRKHAGVKATAHIDRKPDGMHVLQINDVDFFFYADGSGYDGWGQSLEHTH